MNIDIIKQQITQFEKKYGRDPGSVQLLAVSKRHSAEEVKSAYACGQTLFGENQLQEALDKIETLQDYPIEWHYIGRLQSNKAAKIAHAFAWVHSVDRLSIAERLNDQRSESLPPLNVCIQVNIDNEPQKAGILLNDINTFASHFVHLPRLRLRGLMALPKRHQTLPDQRAAFARCREALSELNASGFGCDTLSMGMSHDFEAAIAEGATLLRLGTAIFGERVT